MHAKANLARETRLNLITVNAISAKIINKISNLFKHLDLFYYTFVTYLFKATFNLSTWKGRKQSYNKYIDGDLGSSDDFKSFTNFFKITMNLELWWMKSFNVCRWHDSDSLINISSGDAGVITYNERQKTKKRYLTKLWQVLDVVVIN